MPKSCRSKLEFKYFFQPIFYEKKLIDLFLWFKKNLLNLFTQFISRRIRENENIVFYKNIILQATYFNQ